MMRIMHRTLLVGRVTAGLLWGGLLVVAGLNALLSPEAAWMSRWPAALLGCSGIAAGTFIFMFVVADRLVRVQRRGPIDAIELALAGLMLALFALGLAVWFTEGGG